MIDNILSALPSLDSDEVESFSLEEIEAAEAQEKQDRIAFHRAHVRNGPAKFKGQTSGQARRAGLRDIKRGQRKARRHQVANFFAAQQEHARLRGHLTAVGVLAPAVEGATLDEDRSFRSAKSLVADFGDLERSGDDLLADALQKAYDRYRELSGLEPQQIEYAS